MAKVEIRNEPRADGRYSLYVKGATNGAWYTGLNFGSYRRALKVQAFLNRELAYSRAWPGES